MKMRALGSNVRRERRRLKKNPEKKKGGEKNNPKEEKATATGQGPQTLSSAELGIDRE